MVYAWFRLTIGVMYGIELVTIIVLYPEAIFIHFTFWGIMTLVLAYLMFAYDHARRGHFIRSWSNPDFSDQELSNTSDLASFWVLWKASNVCFQIAFLINHSIAVYYWFVIWPYVKLKEKLYMEDYP